MIRNDRCFLRNVQDVKHIFGDKWTIPVMVALAGGPMRRAQIFTTVDSYSIDENWPGKATVLHDSILSRTLRKMLAEGLIAREELADGFPRHVRYELRPEAADFLARVHHVIAWSRKNSHVVANAQDFHRQQSGESDSCVHDVCGLPANN